MNEYPELTGKVIESIEDVTERGAWDGKYVMRFTDGTHAIISSYGGSYCSSSLGFELKEKVGG